MSAASVPCAEHSVLATLFPRGTATVGLAAIVAAVWPSTVADAPARALVTAMVTRILEDCRAAQRRHPALESSINFAPDGTASIGAAAFEVLGMALEGPYGLARRAEAIDAIALATGGDAMAALAMIGSSQDVMDIVRATRAAERQATKRSRPRRGDARAAQRARRARIAVVPA